MNITKKILTIVKILIFSVINPYTNSVAIILRQLKIFDNEIIISLLAFTSLPIFLYSLYHKTNNAYAGKFFLFLNTAVSNRTFFVQLSFVLFAFIILAILYITDGYAVFFGKIPLVILIIYAVSPLIVGYILMHKDSVKTLHAARPPQDKTAL
ncbi:ABC-type multidrug transport system permease subunit [Elusimicrobium simillimum]|uniref:hypothetical protein n=1 Tax=Elusimicrobium simillimum TaxID=3143438 RepID=UPI003C70377A